jgi:hydroxymethylbilane synthase
LKTERPLIIGTRGSKLALWQSEYIARLITQHTGRDVELRIIKTKGDRILDVPLAKVGGKGLFTKELEVALMAGEVDLCVHSMKDVPTELPEGLVIGATPARVDPRDALVAHGACTDLSDIAQGARIGTSSLRRRAQIAAIRPDLELIDVRGNLDTRMRKAEEGEVEAVILAAAGITRMGWADRISAYIPTDVMVSAVGQGAIAVEIRADDAFMQEVCGRINDDETMVCVSAERVVMRELDGGCQVPIGAYARIEDGEMVMDGMVASTDGTTLLRDRLTGRIDNPQKLGLQMVETLKQQGATEVLAAVRAAVDASDDGNVHVLF